jgi:hypothetical protein
MKNISIVLLAMAGFVINSPAATNFAARVISYDPGTNFAAGFTNTAAVLGEPSRVNPFGEDTDPFNPPYGQDQVLSIGEGGSLVVKFDRPVFNTPRRPFGIDFVIFGNTGFIITNEFDPMTFQWIGTPATDGSLFANNPGTTRVSVSTDGAHFFPIDPERAPTVDGLFPTDGTGDFALPVNPSLTASNFAGATLADMRALYAGSAGGTGYNITRARTRHGRPVFLPYVRFVRIEVSEGKAEIDGVSATARARRRNH